MDAPGSLAKIDLISADAVPALGAVEGPCVSVLMPTHRLGPETLRGPVRLRNLAEQAARDLIATGTPAGDATDLLAPVRALLDDATFWQHQGDGLAVFAAPDWCSRFRKPMTLVEGVMGTAPGEVDKVGTAATADRAVLERSPTGGRSSGSPSPSPTTRRRRRY